jgi:hypothetical protein
MATANRVGITHMSSVVFHPPLQVPPVHGETPLSFRLLGRFGLALRFRPLGVLALDLAFDMKRRC